MIWIDNFRKFKKPGQYGFNVYDDEKKLMINGYRIVNGKLSPPSIMYGKGRYFPAVLVTEKVATDIYYQVVDRTDDLKDLSILEEAIKDIVITEEKAKIFIPKLEIF